MSNTNTTVGCPTCGNPTDAAGRCWPCDDRPCEVCAHPTGRAMVRLCIPCGHAFNGNRGGWSVE
jgi:hypothetical protein